MRCGATGCWEAYISNLATLSRYFGQDLSEPRPRDTEIAKEYEKSFAKVELFTIDNVFGGWTKAQKDHFAEGGIFDQIYKN